MSIIAVPTGDGHTLIGSYGELRAWLVESIAQGRLTRDGVLSQGVMPDGRCYVQVRLLDEQPTRRPLRWPVVAAVLTASTAVLVLAVAWIVAHWAMLLGASLVALAVVAVLDRIRR